MVGHYIPLDGAEEWREYVFGGQVYRIDHPKSIQYRDGGTTHKVEDADGIWHILPAPGYCGCVVRFKGTVVA